MDTNRSTLHRLPTRPRLHGLFVVTLATAAGCSKELPPPPYVANPDPRDAHNVTLTLDNAPEDLRPTGAHVQYRIVDTRCMPPVTNFAGVRRERAIHHLNIALRRVDATTYVGSYFADGLLEKDYYGHGVCRWEVNLVGAFLDTEKTRSFTYFSLAVTPGMRRMKIFADRSIRPLRNDGEKYRASGWSEEQFALRVPEAERSNYFSYSLAIDSSGASLSADASPRHKQ